MCIILYTGWPQSGHFSHEGVHTYFINLLFDVFVVYVAIRLVWGAWRFFARPRNAGRKRQDSDQGTTRRPRGRFETNGKNIQDAEFEDVSEKDK